MRMSRRSGPSTAFAERDVAEMIADAPIPRVNLRRVSATGAAAGLGLIT
jgi:hypothetical protein